MLSHSADKFDFLSALALSLAYLVQRPFSVDIGSLSSKVALTVMGIATFYLFALYTCDLTSRMTGPAPNPTHSFDDVLQRGYTVVYYPGFSSSKDLTEAQPGTCQQH
jgi:hypothetical protein